MDNDQPATADKDMLYGVPAIAGHLNMRPRQVYHLVEKAAVPTFTIPGVSTICARRSTLNAWLDECEAKARAGA